MAAKPDGEVKAMEAALSSLKPEEKKRVLLWLWERLEVAGPAPAATLSSASPVTPGAVIVNAGIPAVSRCNSYREKFLGAKEPKIDAERITCLAYYLTHYKATPAIQNQGTPSVKC